jgi:hypothetical protein
MMHGDDANTQQCHMHSSKELTDERNIGHTVKVWLGIIRRLNAK